MKELNRIQKRNNLNIVFSKDAPHPINRGQHHYMIARKILPTETNLFDEKVEQYETIVELEFQNGPRNEPGSISGVLDTDLLEIVRDRLTAFQSGPYSTRENAIALTHIEEALLWMNKRVEDRAAAGTLGTTKI